MKFRIGFKNVANIVRSASMASLIISLSLTVQAQSAPEIVAKYVAAMGGKERLQSINSIYVEGVAVSGNGTTIDAKLWKVYDRLFRQEISTGSNSVVTIVTPGRGWATNASSNGTFKPLPSDLLKAMRPQIDPAGPLVDYAAKGCRVDLEGRDSVNGISCYKIRLSCPMGQSVTYFIDAKTYYIVRETGRGAMMCVSMPDGADKDVTIDFSDYKKTPEGYIFPYSIITNAFGAKMTIEKVEINHNVDVEALSRPRPNAPAQAKRSEEKAQTGI